MGIDLRKKSWRKGAKISAWQSQVRTCAPPTHLRGCQWSSWVRTYVHPAPLTFLKAPFLHFDTYLFPNPTLTYQSTLNRSSPEKKTPSKLQIISSNPHLTFTFPTPTHLSHILTSNPSLYPSILTQTQPIFHCTFSMKVKLQNCGLEDECVNP